MRSISELQKDVKNLLGDDMNFQIDRPHSGKEKHVDFTTITPQIGGADKVEVDFNGNVIGGLTLAKPSLIGIGSKSDKLRVPSKYP